jgi:iron complex transport system substrate-binding protein
VSAPTRRDFLRLTAAAALLAACGRTSSGQDDAGASASPSAPPSPTTRTVTTDAGPLEVPAEPERVVAAIGSFETDMVAVGVMPVLTTNFAGPWVELDDSVTITKNIPPTAEELLLADPDLIVGWTWVTQEPGFGAMQRIAPYVGLGESQATAGPGFDGGEPFRSWDTLFLSVADAVGRRERGEQMIAELDARLDELAARRAGEPPTSVARIEFYDEGSFSYRGQDEDTAELMRRIGLDVAGPAASINEESLERLPDIDADWLVVPVGGDGLPRGLYEDVAATDLFRAIPAVQAGRLVEVDGALWPGLGHLWARALVDDLERLFVPSS